MELRHLRYFLVVQEEGNITRAAEKLGMQQPPLSQQIKDLEREVGASLFHRTPKGVELTEAGRAFLAGIEDIPVLIEQALREAQYAARGETGALRVGFTGAAGIDPAVQGMIRRFRRRYPQVRLTLVEKNTTALASDLREHILDAAFVRATAEHHQEFQVTEISTAELIAVLPKDHAAAASRISSPSLEMSQLRADPFILTPRPVGPTLHDTVLRACREAGFEPILGQTAPQMMSVVSLVAAGLGVSLVPAAMRHLKLEGCTYRKLLDPPLVTLSLVSQRTERSVVVKNFLACSV